MIHEKRSSKDAVRRVPKILEAQEKVPQESSPVTLWVHVDKVGASSAGDGCLISDGDDECRDVPCGSQFLVLL